MIRPSHGRPSVTRDRARALLQNDPVMGGQSSGNFSIVKSGHEAYALFQGDVKNVSFLHAPGFCNVRTVFPHFHVEDASKYVDGAVQLTVAFPRDEDYVGYKARQPSPAVVTPQ